MYSDTGVDRRFGMVILIQAYEKQKEQLWVPAWANFGVMLSLFILSEFYLKNIFLYSSSFGLDIFSFKYHLFNNCRTECAFGV